MTLFRPASLRHSAPLAALALLAACGGGGGGGGSTSSSATAPSITTPPANRSVAAGQTASFSVTASGTAPLSYQWYKGSAAIGGATSASYTTPATMLGDNGSTYKVSVSNSAGSATSAAATLTVTAVAPSITTPPADQSVTAGQTASFSVVAAGTAPLSYQWYKGTSAISGATSASYTTPATVIGDSGSTYKVTVTNSAGSATSSAATLTVSAAAVAPGITTPPANRTVNAGQTASFSVVASGTAPLSYQWYKGTSAIGGATSASYTTPATTAGDNGSTYKVKVSNSAGSATSAAATLTVNTVPVAPSITTPPANQTVTVGQTASFSVVASGTAPLSYQWYKGTSAISGATSASYTTPATVIGDSGSTYKVTVTNSVGNATSSAATLTVVAGSSWSARGVGGGGAQYSPSINPANPSDYYVSCDMSEVFHTTDFGNSYVVLPSSQIEGGHYSAVRFTSDPNILYSLSYANGNYALFVKSVDGGQTWQIQAGDPLPSDDKYSIWADDSRTDRVVLSGYGDIYFSGNGGTSFTDIHTAANSGNGVVVAGVFFDGSDIYIGTSDGLLVSHNGGSTWANAGIPGIPAGQEISSFAGARSGSSIRFFALTANAGDVYPRDAPGGDYYGFVQGMYALDGGTGNWSARMTGIDISSDFVQYIAMAKNDINTVYAGGSDGNTGAPEVMKTSDGGLHWANTFLATGNANIRTGWSGQGGDRGWGFGEAVYGLAVAPNDATKVVITDEGFTHRSSDGGATWEQAYVQDSDEHPAGDTSIAKASYHSSGLEVTSCWDLAWSDAQHLFGGFTDIQGIRSVDGGATWSFNYTGIAANTTYRIVKDPGGTLYAGTSDIHDMYESTHLKDSTDDATDAHGDILMSTNQGAVWTLLHHFGHPVFWLAQDPNNSHRMYASVIHSTLGGVYVTQDLQDGAASVWTLIPNPSRAAGHPASLVVLNDGKLLATFSARYTSNFTASSGVFLYNPGTSSWSDVSDPSMDYWTRDVVVDPADATQNTWYAGVFSGWGGSANDLGGLYKTVDRGAHWTQIYSATDPLSGAKASVTAITQNPNNLDEAYITTETLGLWHTTNLHAATPTFTRVDDYPFAEPERVFFNPFVAGEVWVSSFGDGLKMR